MQNKRLKAWHSNVYTTVLNISLNIRWWYFCSINCRVGKTKTSGEIGEYHARIYLQHQGLSFVAANWHCRGGEIDLIMRHTLKNGDNFLVFVEVKTRKLNSQISAEESVNFHKQKRLVHAANKYLQQINYESYCRFDVVTVDILANQHTQIKDWIQGAFEG